MFFCIWEEHGIFMLEDVIRKMLMPLHSSQFLLFEDHLVKDIGLILMDLRMIIWKFVESCRPCFFVFFFHFLPPASLLLFGSSQSKLFFSWITRWHYITSCMFKTYWSFWRTMFDRYLDHRWLRGEWWCLWKTFIITPSKLSQLFRYVHSYQSYLWNHAASMRVQKYGLLP